MVSKAARRYTIAMYGVAEEKGKLDEVTKDIYNSLAMLQASRDLELFFESPIINKSKKLTVIKDVFGGKVSDMTMNFMNLLVSKSDMHFDIDKDIIGGFVAKINDTILDASIKRQLERLKNKFREGDYNLN